MGVGFQTQVYSNLAPGVAGAFCDANPRYTVDAGPGGLVAGAGGVTIGNFAWANDEFVDGDGAASIVQSFGSGPVTGFVGREQQGLNSTYLSDAGLSILQGFPVTLFSGGGFWALNSGASQALPGMKAYANFLTGAVSFAVTGSPTTASATSSSIASGTAATCTGTIVGNVLTTSGSVTNTIYPGAVVTGTGVASGTTIVQQLTGTTGGAGTYAVSIPEQSVASTSLTITPYVLDTTGGTVTGTIVVGSVLQSAGGTATGTVVGMSAAAVYASGKYVMAPAPGQTSAGTVTSGTIVLASNVETKWYARTSGLAGEIVKISDKALG